MAKIWRVKNRKKTFPPELEKKYSLIMLNLLAKRGIKNAVEIEKYFHPDYDSDLSDPIIVVGMEKAVERILEAKKKKEKIAIFGDYDADGVTASAVLYEAFLAFGFTNDIICYIPDRQTEGYGLNVKAINYLYKKGVQLIITVDCGIANAKEVEEAKKLKIDVIITDHHYIPPKLPKAYAVINPHIENSGFNFDDLAGVGVAFSLAQALSEKINNFKKEQLKWLLDLVAIGTIADCVPLLGENRVLVKYGLLVLSKTKRKGLREMFKVGRIDISENNLPSSHKVAFQISPRLNAAGRMDHANVAYELLIEKDSVSARDLALEIENNNQQRQKITKEIFQEVEAIVNHHFQNKKFILAKSSHWPVGLLGLVAGKITEKFKKPTLIMQQQEDKLVGSLRSIPEVNIVKNLEKCHNLLIKFGGHPQAAGMSIKPENLEKFYEKMERLVEEEMKKKKAVNSLEIDLEIRLDDINWDLLNDLKKMEPFGTGNPEPIFLARNVAISDLKIIGNGKKHFKLLLKSCEGSPKIFEAVGFSLVSKFPNLKKDDKLDIVFKIQENEWNGSKRIQLNLIDLKLV